MKQRFLSLPLVVAAAALCLVFPTVARTQGGAPWAKLARGPVFEVGNETGATDKLDEATVPIPLTLSPQVKPQDVTVRVLDVRLGNHYVQGLTEAFMVEGKVTEAQGRGPFISLKVDFSKARAQGTYNLLIEVATPSQPSPQSFDVQISRPAAKLKSQSTLVAERVLTPFFGPDAGGLSLALSEEGGVTRVTDLEVLPRTFLGDRGEVISGTVKCSGPLPQIMPRAAGKVTCVLDGEFPLGVSRGTVEIRSPQLAEALPVAFEVRTRRAPWLILLVIALGLAAGYLLRTLLQQRVKLREARIQGFDLCDRMQDEAGRRPDETLKRRIEDAVSRLNAVLDSRKADALAAGIVAADAELREALKQLEARRNGAQDELDSFEKLTKTRWSLPAGVSAAVGEARARIEGLRAELLRDNVKTAEDALREARAGLSAGLGKALSEWAGSQREMLEVLDKRYLPASVAAALRGEVAEARELLDGAADLGGNPALEDMFAALEATHRARARLSGLLGKLGRWLQYEAEETVRALRKTTPPDEPPVRAVKEAAAGLTKELAAMKEPEEAPALLTPERLRGLNETWRDAVEKQLAGTAFLDEERAKVITLLDGRNYAAAAQAAQVVITQKRRKMLGTARGG
ncbi:MAG: hypothetical protein WCD76_03080, partial [Pyrinomonadaceae bacterium]